MKSELLSLNKLNALKRCNIKGDDQRRIQKLKKEMTRYVFLMKYLKAMDNGAYYAAYYMVKNIPRMFKNY